jgi:hypothetical protein
MDKVEVLSPYAAEAEGKYRDAKEVGASKYTRH